MASQFTKEERTAMKEHADAQRKAAKRGKATREDGLIELQEKVAEMPPADRLMAERIHEIVTEEAPELWPRTYYGMPAWALPNGGKVVIFFQPASKFKYRYATLGFNEDASLDEGAMWATSFALTALSTEVEARIARLVKQAVA